MQFTLSKTTIISIILVGVLIIGGAGYLLGQSDTQPTTPSNRSLAVGTGETVERDTPTTQENTEVVEKPIVQEVVLVEHSGLKNPTPGQICARDRTEKRDNSLTPFLTTDLGKIYTQIESLEIAGKNLDTSWRRYTESLSEIPGKEEEYNRAYSQYAKVSSIPRDLFGFGAITGIMMMYDCSILDESGKPTCTDTQQMGNMKSEMVMGPDNTYVRTLSSSNPEDDEGNKFIFEGKLGDPGNLIVTMDSLDTGKSVFTTTRDIQTGKETFTVQSKKDNFTLTEYSDCSGTAKTRIQVSADVVQDVELVWSMSGSRTTGTIVSRSSDPSLNAEYSW